MPKTSPIHPSDLLGFSRLAIDAASGITDLVEAMHLNIARAPGMLGVPARGSTSGITGLVYESIRGAAALMGAGMDAMLAPIIPLLGERSSPPGREAVLAALNGVMGDHLAATHNPLAISMTLRRGGKPLTLEQRALAAAIPGSGSKLLIVLHGLCMNDLQCRRKGHDHGAALARDLGYTPVYLHYNSGLHVSTNGRAFARLAETLLDQWPAPLEDFAIVAHSMGGLVVRSAYHYGSVAGHDWPRALRKIVFLGTPHHGAPLERGGNWVNLVFGLSPYTAPFARLGRIRSAGITDLRYGNLLDDDWQGRDRFDASPDLRQPVPLPEGVQCYAMAAATGKRTGALTDMLGDGIVPVNSALGRHKDPQRALSFAKSRQWVAYGTNHFDLLSGPAVYQRIQRWLAA